MLEDPDVDWTLAKCLTSVYDSDLWFSHSGVEQALAKSICRTCPLQQPCLQRALDAEGSVCASNRYGIFGGLGTYGRFYLREQSKSVVRKNGKIVRREQFVKCGTIGGYRKHLRRGQLPDYSCSEAARIYRAALKREKEAS